MSPLPVNVTSLQGTITSFSNVFHNFSISAVVAIVFLLVAFLLFSLIIRNILSSFIPRFSLLTIILVVSYLVAFSYYVPVYIPQTFVTVVNNTTVVNTNVTSHLLSTYNFIIITKFYDNLLYYMAQYKVSPSDILVPYVILILFYIYFIYALYNRIGKMAIPIAALLLFVITLGMTGLMFASITYSTLLYMDLSLALLSAIAFVLA
ncbi:MAG: hypothetical protein ACP5GJ_03545 [Nanopusillaceae archaeon]